MPKSPIDKTDPMPRYLQVRRVLEESVRSGQYRPGSQLPGERELAQQLQVSQMTVNKAILALVGDGWLRREIGKGTFVNDGFRPPLPEVLRIGFAVPVTAEFVQEDYYLGALLRGIQRAVTNAPVSLTLLETPTDSLYERLIEAPVDGFLLTDVLDRCLDDVQRLAQAGRKMVLLGADREPLHVPFVDSDNYGGARAAVEHLLGLGHRRIAGVFAYTNTCNTRHRVRAYLETLREHRIEAPPEFLMAFGNIYPPEFLMAAGKIYPLLEPVHTQIAQLLTGTPRPTAFFCGGYYLALEAMKAAQEAGLRLPDDISIVGFDDPVSARYVSPPLTTVHQPLEEMGRHATLKLLHWLRTQEEPPLRDVLPATLRIRGTTAPAALETPSASEGHTPSQLLSTER